jgi:hypothetical protein
VGSKTHRSRGSYCRSGALIGVRATASQFDKFSYTYDADLHRALSVSGEEKGYVARGRVNWLRPLHGYGQRVP